MPLDNVHRFESDHLRPLDARADGSPQADLKLPGFHPGEDFRTHPGEQNVNEHSGSHDVDRDQGPAKPEDEPQVVAIKRAQLLKETALVSVPGSHHPGGKHRHKSA